MDKSKVWECIEKGPEDPLDAVREATRTEYKAMVEERTASRTRTNNDLYRICDSDYFFGCMTEACAFNKEGICLFHAVEEDMPTTAGEDGCLSGGGGHRLSERGRSAIFSPQPT